jgi:hypothetical protein
MKLFKINISVAVFVLALSFISCNDRDANGTSHGNNQPAANTETGKDSTGLMPRENVKTAQEDYKDSSNANDSTAMGTEKK